MAINKATISGNLTRSAELRQTSSGAPVLAGGLAFNERVKRGEKWEDRANFIDWSMFGSRAEKLQQYLVKGTKVCLTGRLRYSEWEKDGERRSKIELLVDDLEFMSRADGGQQQMDSALDDEIPF